MDRVLRTYAHSAWTPADPLAGLDEEVRRFILLMPSTFRERWKLSPWTDRYHRRMAMVDIIAERRLQYELTHKMLAKTMPAPAPAPGNAVVRPSDEQLSPYWRYRMALHRDTGHQLYHRRLTQDFTDADQVPGVDIDRARLEARSHALQEIEIERAKLNVRELELLADRDPVTVTAAPLAAKKRARGKSKKREAQR